MKHVDKRITSQQTLKHKSYTDHRSLNEKNK